jgi:F-type H+-transporting ATPase subunit delta
MAELATIARPYAEALFKASQADLEGAAGWLEPLAAVAGVPQLLQLAAKPKVRAQQVIEV